MIAVGLALLLRQVSSPAARYRLSFAGLGAVVAAGVLTWAVLNAPKPSVPETTATPSQSIEPLPAPAGPVEKIVVAANWTPAQQRMQWTAWLALAWLLGASAMLGRASVKVAGALRTVAHHLDAQAASAKQADPCLAEAC